VFENIRTGLGWSRKLYALNIVISIAECFLFTVALTDLGKKFVSELRYSLVYPVFHKESFCAFACLTYGPLQRFDVFISTDQTTARAVLTVLMLWPHMMHKAMSSAQPQTW
jgi:hypothetical protein